MVHDNEFEKYVCSSDFKMLVIININLSTCISIKYLICKNVQSIINSRSNIIRY